MPTPSCDQCHRRRLQCAGGKPSCQHCASTGQICTYSTGKPVGKPKGHRKVRKDTPTDLQPSVQPDHLFAQRRFDSTTSDSSPNHSDFNEAGSSSLMKPRPSTATIASSSPLSARSMPTTMPITPNIPISTFTAPSTSLPDNIVGNMRLTGDGNLHHQPSGLEAVTWTMGMAARPLPPDALQPLDPNYFAWQGLLEHPCTTAPTQSSGVSLPFFDPSGSLHSQPPLLQPSLVFADQDTPASGLYAQNVFSAPSWQLPSSGSCPTCHKLTGTVVSLFRSNFDGHIDFDTVLPLLHSSLEDARRYSECIQCSMTDGRRHLMLAMALQQSLICGQRMLSLAMNEKISFMSAREPDQGNSAGAMHSRDFDGLHGERNDLQASVRLSVTQMEFAALRQLIEGIKSLLMPGNLNWREYASTGPLWEGLEEALVILQQSAFPSRQ